MKTTTRGGVKFSTDKVGQKRLKNVRFDLSSIIENIVQTIADQPETGEVEIVCDIDSSVRVMVKSDPDCLQQLIMTLVSYAVKCADPGGVSIHVTQEKETKSSLRGLFSISFHGSGTFKDGLNAIQEDHFNETDISTPESIGTDPTLLKPQQLAKRMRSSIHVINLTDRGSKITFSINFKREIPITPNEPEEEFKGVRILLVDDNLSSQQALTGMLKELGCRVKSVASGNEVHPAVVRGLISNSPFRVVLLDMEMPVMDGVSVLRMLRKDDLTKYTKVIFLVSNRKVGKLDNISKLDYSSYLLKPVLRSKLREALESTIGLHHENQRGDDRTNNKEAAEIRNGQNLKVLLVEDDEANQKIGALILRHLGCIVDTACCGEDAVVAVRSRDYDLVFMDVQMLEMSGLEAARRIRAIKNHRKNVPIIAMTAHEMAAYEQRCLEAGMNDFVTKPFNINHISHIINACGLGHYRKQLNPELLPEPVARPPDAQVLNIKMGMLVFENDGGNYEAFLKEFIEGLPKRLEKMVNALSDMNWDLLRRDAHNLKGISANLGVMKISALASQLEVQSRDRAKDQAHTTIDQIREAVAELMKQVPSMISMLLESSIVKSDV